MNTLRIHGLVLGLTVVAGLAVSGQTWQTPREWRDYGGGADSSRFVAATQIDQSNVSRLEVAWTYPMGQTDFNPVVVRGVVYGRGPSDTFIAVDAATGRELWSHKAPRGSTYAASTTGRARTARIGG